MMKMHTDCIPCFFKQALGAAKLAGADETAQRKILNELVTMIPGFSFELSPPELSRDMYRMIVRMTGNGDPFRSIKERSNALALGLYPELSRRASEGTSLLNAVELAIAANVIDFGVRKSLDIDEELRKIMGVEKSPGSRKTIFHYEEFERALERASSILYLGDNAGEVVFDRVLIEEIQKRYPGRKIVYAVKERPVINDALVQDAFAAGLGDVCDIISSGSDAPGTILRTCTAEFAALFGKADMVISKGQGNYETLSEEGNAPVFFLFIAKCEVVTKHLGCRFGDAVLLDLSTSGRRDV